MIQSLWRTVWRFLKKLNIELPYDPAIPLLAIYPEKIIIRKDTCTPLFIAELFTIARTWKQSTCSIFNGKLCLAIPRGSQMRGSRKHSITYYVLLG